MPESALSLCDRCHDPPFFSRCVRVITAPMLEIRDLTYRIGGRTLFEDAVLTVADGQKIGVVGRNGTGKTTLFRLIVGDLEPHAGVVTVRRGARVGCVAQEAPDGDESLLDTVLSADGERAALLAEAETATDPERIATVHTRLADIDAYAAPARAARILAGLGFDEAAQGGPCRALSGGWRMRLALAAVLFARPGLLLLDEPTNHLDLEAAMWLEGYLAGWRGTMLMISHDRGLLNRAVDGIVHLEGGRLIRYVGGYDTFDRTRRERLEHDARARDRQATERRRIEAFVERFRAKATKARQAQSRIKMLARMQPPTARIAEWVPDFALPEAEPLPPPAIVCDGAAVGYDPSRPVLRDLDLRLDMDDRIALLGANGNGKSTLMRLLGGRLAPQRGRVVCSQRLRVGYFAQHQLEELVADDTPFQHAARRRPDDQPAAVRAHLGSFGFSQDLADSRVGSLSGGEKARLLLALMCLDRPHVLLLDEPTNHLDIDARESLVSALNEFGGAVVIVTHDASLIHAVCDRLWRVADGRCEPFDGDLDDYRAQVLAAERSARRGQRPAVGDDRRRVRQDRAAARRETAPLRAAAKEAEAQMERLHAQARELEARLADPALYSRSSGDVTDVQQQLAETRRRLDAAEDAWLAAHEALEDVATTLAD